MSQAILGVLRGVAEEEEDDMGDIEYLAIKEFDAKRVDANATLTLNNTSTQTDLVTQTAQGGKDMYLAEASIGGQVNNEASGEVGGVTYILFVNGVEADRFRVENPDDLDVSGSWTHKFTTKGIKVLTTQIIKITAKNDLTGINTTTTHEGVLLLWEEDTATTPAI